MATTEHIDLTLINGYLEALDISVIEQMFDLYIQQSQVYLSAIKNALNVTNQNEWQSQCHKMKGAAASAGLSLVQAKLATIEKSTQDWQIKAELFAQLEALNDQAIAAFRQWLAEQ